MLRKWDPTFGWENKIFYLATSENYTPFFKSPNGLCTREKFYLKSNDDFHICAGSFSKDFYFGSVTYIDAFRRGSAFDQGVIVYDKNFEKIAELRPSSYMTEKSNFFTLTTNLNGQLSVPFRDPSLMPNGNLAVCTGGSHWGTPGNVCEVEFKHNKLRIIKDSIIDSSLIKFAEIERVTFWNEFMFFSARGNGFSKIEQIHKNINIEPEEMVSKIQVAKLNKNGVYKYFGEVENSDNCYGPSVDKHLRLLFWYPKTFEINNPFNKNLFYTRQKYG